MTLAIRWLHVAAMAVAFGGAFLVRHEQVFWAAAGVLVMTGIGSLSAFGVSLLEPGTAWGTTFIAKLWLVAALILVSLPLARGRAARLASADKTR